MNKGIELVFFEDGEYKFREHKDVLKNVLGDSLPGVSVKTEDTYISNSVWEDGKKRSMYYKVLKVTARDNLSNKEHVYTAHTIH